MLIFFLCIRELRPRLGFISKKIIFSIGVKINPYNCEIHVEKSVSISYDFGISSTWSTFSKFETRKLCSASIYMNIMYYLSYTSTTNLKDKEKRKRNLTGWKVGLVPSSLGHSARNVDHGKLEYPSLREIHLPRGFV